MRRNVVVAVALNLGPPSEENLSGIPNVQRFDEDSLSSPLRRSLPLQQSASWNIGQHIQGSNGLCIGRSRRTAVETDSQGIELVLVEHFAVMEQYGHNYYIPVCQFINVSSDA